MVRINEWMPNPAGSDAPGEWIELYNDGSAPAALSGWRITADGKSLFALKGVIAPRAYFVVHRAKSKLALRNTDGALILYDASGRVADRAEFRGSAPEGKAASRVSYGVIFGDPTPGEENGNAGLPMLETARLEFGVPLNPSQGVAPFFTMLATSLALAAAAVFILKAHAILPNFFRR